MTGPPLFKGENRYDGVISELYPDVLTVSDIQRILRIGRTKAYHRPRYWQLYFSRRYMRRVLRGVECSFYCAMRKGHVL